MAVGEDAFSTARTGYTVGLFRTQGATGLEAGQ